MSNYKDFIQDFPVRCSEILEEFRKQAEKSDREVTHMLAIASVALTFPFERLRKRKHPSADNQKYKQAAEIFYEICSEKFVHSVLCAGSWNIGEIVAEETMKDSELWEGRYESLPEDASVKKILTHIRNALAHGSIFTKPDEQNQIKTIIFLSEIRNNKNKFTGKYKVLTISPSDFNIFLVKWIHFLQNNLKLPANG